MACAYFPVFVRAFQTGDARAPCVAPCHSGVWKAVRTEETEHRANTHVPSALTGMESPSGTNSKRMKTLRHSAAMT